MIKLSKEALKEYIKVIMQGYNPFIILYKANKIRLSIHYGYNEGYDPYIRIMDIKQAVSDYNYNKGTCVSGL